MTATVSTPKTTVPPERLGRCRNVDAVMAKHGADAVQPVIDGYMTADDLALLELEAMAMEAEAR